VDQNTDAKGSELSSPKNLPGRSLAAIVFSAVASVVLLSQPGNARAQLGPPIIPGAEPTEDGLVPLDPAIMGVAWVRPDADLSRYARLFAMPTAVQFRDVRDRPHNARSIEGATAFFVDEGRKAQLRRVFRASFEQALPGIQSFELTDALGRDVLLVQGILTDVISGVPPYYPGSAITNIRWAWEANIVLEIRDAMSDTVLARTVERQRMDGPLDASMAGALTPKIVNGWTWLLITHLEELRSFYPSRLSRLGGRSTE